MLIANKDTEEQLRLIKRVRQIAMELDSEFVNDYMDQSLDVLAFRLKSIAIHYNCYIQSWTGADCEGVHGFTECYNAADYIEEEDDTWELISSDNEPLAVVTAFKWLADRGYLIPVNYQDA